MSKEVLKIRKHRAFPLTLIEVRLRNAANNDAEVAKMVSAVLKDTLCHLLSHLLEYFLAQLQANDWAMEVS